MTNEQMEAKMKQYGYFKRQKEKEELQENWEKAYYFYSLMEAIREEVGFVYEMVTRWDPIQKQMLTTITIEA